jgi:uncharacterized protein involved in exopolysaccharide biosynthesis
MSGKTGMHKMMETPRSGGNMQENMAVEGDEVSLVDLWQTVRDGWRWVMGGTALGAVVAGLTLAVLPTQYEAVAVIQVGQVGQVGQLGGVPVESSAQAVERIRTGSFQIEAANASGYTPWAEVAAHSAKAGEAYFSLQVVKNTSLIELRTKATTRADAGKIANGIVETLALRHHEMASPAIARMNEELALAQDKVTNAEKDMAWLAPALLKNTNKERQFSPLALLATILQYKQTELFTQRQLIGALKVALGSPSTQPAKTLEPIFIAENPVSPKKTLIAVLGSLAGLIFGLLAVFVVNAWQSRNKKIS